MTQPNNKSGDKKKMIIIIIISHKRVQVKASIDPKIKTKWEKQSNCN